MIRKIGFYVVTGLILVMLFLSMKKQNGLKVGDRIPQFILKDQQGKDFNSEDYRGKTAMVIYFYPKDDTPGCIKEACSFRDAYEVFSDKNVKVIGISSDSVESHKNFADKYNLPFTLLADTDKKVRRLFGVPSSALGLLPGRVTYVVDKEGIIIYIYNSMSNAEKHVTESLKMLN